MKSIINIFNVRSAWLIVITAVLMAGGVSVASAETLMMPDRDTRMGTNTVVWGVTTQANGTAYTLDCGDTAVTQNIAGNVADRSYITLVCNYPTEGPKTATLTVGAEVATVDVQVFDPTFPALAPAAAADANRSLGINMAIEDGLRFLWTNQSGRAANFPASPTTSWSGGYGSSGASVVTAAFQNQSYQIPSDGSPPTGLYEKYVVQRGLNFVISNMTTIVLGVTPQGDNPCVGTPAGDPCTGLYDRRAGVFHQSYTTGVALAPLAASGALTKVVAAADVPGNLSAGYVVGKSYGEILQRMANALAWGQIDAGRTGRGGWFYNFNGFNSDGSTIGWVLLGLFDAEAAGAIVPAWVKAEHVFAVNASVNNDGTLDYQSDGNPVFNNNVGPAKNGIGLQALFFTGELAGARLAAVTNAVDSWWTGFGGVGGDVWGCSGVNVNKACGYTMFNNFKGLKLQGIQTLPTVARPAGPGAIPANDWHEDYKDWLVANQSAPTTVGGGSWPGMRLSAIWDGRHDFSSGLAELILSPVALVLPDPIKFATIGLKPFTDTDLEENSHTVTATAESTNGAPVPGATVDFVILTGPNAGLFTGTDVTDVNGEATFTYTDAGPLGTIGTDTIQANIGALKSNIVDMIWTSLINSPPFADANGPYSGDEGSPIALDGSGSSDPDGDPMSYSWTVDSALCSFSDATAESPTLTCTDNGIVTVTLTVTDDSGLNDSATSTVDVANVAPTVGPVIAPTDPVALNTPVNISATYTDPGSSDTHTALCDWGDGTVEDCTVDGAGNVTGSHSYPGAGVHLITVTVTDDDGGIGSNTSEYVVVYDPDGGFVTGGGWIDSPPGAYVADASLAGRAHFGFNSKYKKGTNNTPDGSTQFTYQVGNLNFHSNTYDWLVVAGAKAQYKGVGTFNGMPGYSFMLTAVDGGLKADDGYVADGFRIKIWHAGGVIYDNSLGVGDNVTPQDIAQGSIVIHVPKGGK